ncbi:hypothetical protein [Aeromonas sobria]|uniref:hypothetical protein n=1 Tax=Aeromonas sobria TaxID=646 RepID=UPI003F2FD8BB
MPYAKLLHVRVCFKDRSEWDLYEKSVKKMKLSLLFAQNMVFLQKPTHIQKLTKALNFGENHEKRWRWLATFFKNAGGERVN